MGNKEIRRTLKKLLADGSEVRLNTPSEPYLGKIFKVTQSEVILKPYAVQEPLSSMGGNVRRARIEEEIGLPLPIKTIIPEKMSEGYIEKMIKSINYFGYKSVRDENLRDLLFEGYPLPTSEEIDILERRLPESTNLKKSQDGTAGFKYANKDIKL